MVINPVSELKRRLDDAEVPLSKRLCLARNVAETKYLPTSVRERALTEWLDRAGTERDVVQDVLTWEREEMSADLIGKIIEVVSKFTQSESVDTEFAERVICLLEDDKVVALLSLQLREYLNIFKSLLETLRNNEDIKLSRRVLENLINAYKKAVKKVDFIVKFVENDTLETVFRYLSVPELRSTSLAVCAAILFPAVKKSHFATLLQTLIREENIDKLLEEKGDNIKYVLKVMTLFFAFNINRSESFLTDYIDAFVASFQNDSHLIFMFLIVAVSSLNIQQTYLNTASDLPAITFKDNDDKIKRSILLKCLESLKENDVDLNVKLTEILGEKFTKVEIKKNFTSFLQATIMATLKLEGKPDKITLQLINVALKLDPNLIEPKLDLILPGIMCCKKNKNVIEPYTEMLNSILETLFKLSRGTDFLSRMLPLLKTSLEAVNTEQFQLKEEFQDALDNGTNFENLKLKIINESDLFPEECIERYGRLTSNLMLKQNVELFISLQREFEMQCLLLLEEGFVSPSVILLCSLLASILSSCLRHSKMADHSVPPHIANEFWTNFNTFGRELLSKLGKCLLGLTYNPDTTSSFLRMCDAYLSLRLLNARYGNTRTDEITITGNPDVLDFGSVLPCLSSDEWIQFSHRVVENRDCVDLLNRLMLLKLTVCDLCNPGTEDSTRDDYKHRVKIYLITQINNIWSVLDDSAFFVVVLFSDLDASQEQNIAKAVLKRLELDPDFAVLDNVAIAKNKTLTISLTMETLKAMLKIIEDEEFLKTNKSLRKAIKAGFELEEIVKGSSGPTIFANLSKSVSLAEPDNQERISHYLEILKKLNISQLDENTQILSIFIILALKNIISDLKMKKLKKYTDELLLEIFEMSHKKPNLLKIFPVDYVFAFDNAFLTVATLNKAKTTNSSIIIKSILELSVKKVKTDSDTIKKIVNILLSNKKKIKNINFFNDQANQITCIVLPIIAREKKAITTSQYRTILAELQEKLHKFLLKSFKHINFDSGNTDDNVTATLNAIESYSLTLSKYCESKSEEDVGNLDSLSESLEFFIEFAISAIENADTKPTHVDQSLQLMNISLRNIKRLENKKPFIEKEDTLLKVWRATVSRLSMGGNSEDIANVMRLTCELCSVDTFVKEIGGELSAILDIKPIKTILDHPEDLSGLKTAKYILSSVLKGNIVGPKSACVAKLTLRHAKNAASWLRASLPTDGLMQEIDGLTDNDGVKTIVLKEEMCEVASFALQITNEVILNAKKISLSYRYMDAIFDLHQSVRRGLTVGRIDDRYVDLLETMVTSLNHLVVHRHELLEDRWPCYLQCYRGVVSLLLSRSLECDKDGTMAERLAQTAHCIEKLTQAIVKHKSQISRLSLYVVADICNYLERYSPPPAIRQAVEAAVVLLIQSSDSGHAAGFLRGTLAGMCGHTTFTNVYAVYKRYYKYRGEH